MALGERGERLTAYTAVPIADTQAYTGQAFGDEYPLARATADAAGMIDLRRIDAAAVSPIAAIREVLEITLQPEHAAGNLFWLLDLYRTAAREGASMILTGQMGNAGISWTGSRDAWPLRQRVAREGVSRFLRRQVYQALPASLEKAYRNLRRPRSFPDLAIAPDFAGRIELSRLKATDPANRPYARDRASRLSVLRPGASNIGGTHAQLGAAAGIEVTDPTADPRLLEFCLSTPDAIFVDPASGTNRWLIREAMRGRLPDAVRCNHKLGHQAADLVPRLRFHADEVTEALDEVGRGPGAAYLDMARLAAVWQRVQVEDTPDVSRLAFTVLTRGIMAGLFVNAFNRSRQAPDPWRC
jgi:asparagine synthase (glutamine-hydrolysing)